MKSYCQKCYRLQLEMKTNIFCQNVFVRMPFSIKAVRITLKPLKNWWKKTALLIVSEHKGIKFMHDKHPRLHTHTDIKQMGFQIKYRAACLCLPLYFKDAQIVIWCVRVFSFRIKKVKELAHGLFMINLGLWQAKAFLNSCSWDYI